jgi:acyl carrier protein
VLVRFDETAVLDRVVRSWRDALGGDVGADDDFFRCGGTSRIATALAVELGRAFGVRVKVGDVLRAGTPRGLVARIGPRLSVPDLPTVDSPVSVSSVHPLSAAQRMLWLAGAQDPTGTGYNEVLALRLRGTVEPDLLGRALAQVQRRHAALHTRFPLGRDGMPFQYVDADAALDYVAAPLPVEPGEDVAGAIARVVDERYRVRFRLADEAPFVARLYRIADDDALLVITVHHLVIDEESAYVVLGELRALYEAACAGAPVELPPARAFAAVQSGGADADAAVPDELRAAFAPWPPRLALPTTNAAPAHKAYAGRRVRSPLPPRATAALHGYATAEHTTPLVVGLAATVALLGRYADADDISVGMPVSVRDVRHAEGVVGPLMNTVLVRTRLAPGLSFRDVTARAREATLAALEHASVPFDAFVRATQPTRDTAPAQVYFAVTEPVTHWTTPHVEWTRLDHDPRRSHYDLRFELVRTDGHWDALVEYDTEQFDALAAATVLHDYVTLLDHALADPDTAVTRAAAPPAAATPKAPTLEALVVELWRETFGIDDVEDETFFALGGTSLLAAQLALRMTTRFGVEVSLLALFEAPTIGELCALLRLRYPEIDTIVAVLNELWAGAPEAAGEPEAAAAPASGEPEVSVMSAGQEQLWISELLQASAGGVNPRVLVNTPVVVAIHGALDRDRLADALRQVVRRQASWRTGLDRRDGIPAQLVYPDAVLPLEFHDLSDRARTDAEAAFRASATERARRRFDLTTPPLLNAALYRLSTVEHWLLVVVHHTVFDGGSARVLLRDLDAFYRGDGADLPPLHTTYRDYSVWERGELTAERSAALAEFWRRELHGATSIFRTAPPPAVAPEAWLTQSHRIAIPDETVALVQQLARDEQASTFMVLLAALNALVAGRTGATDVTVGVPTSNRRLRGAEDLIGYFLNMLPIRVRPGADLTFTELLAAAKASTLRSYEHQQLPYPLIKKAARGAPLDLMLAIGPVHRRVPLGDLTADLDVRDFGAEVAASSVLVYEHDDGLDVEAYCPAVPTTLGAPAELVAEFVRVLDRAVREPGLRCGALTADAAPARS